MEYIDLGLKSRTLWGSDYERDEQGNCLYLTFDEAKERFGDSLPDPWQFQELRDSCKWEWDNERKGYKVTGPNGNSIFLAAMGCRDRTDGAVSYVGSYGYSWSSSASGVRASNLYFYSGDVIPLDVTYRAYGLTVRCVKQAERARPVFYIKGNKERGREVLAMLKAKCGFDMLFAATCSNDKEYYYVDILGNILCTSGDSERRMLKKIGTELHLPHQYKEVPFDIEIAKKIQSEFELKREAAGELQIWQMLAALGIRPYKDGDQWCCLLGENIQEGIAGFGPTPFQSAVAFRNEFMGIE